MVTEQQLKRIYPRSTQASRLAYCDHINKTADQFAIDTSVKMAAFLAQIGHESQQLSKVVESTFYTDPVRLYRLFKSDFRSEADAMNFIRKPEACANRIYANQNGNGPEASGDGWRYRGRGLIQITGRANYRDCGSALGIDLVSKPEILEKPEYACLSAGWFWHTRNCNRLAERGEFVKLTRVINGGTNGLEERKSLFNVAMTIL